MSKPLDPSSEAEWSRLQAEYRNNLNGARRSRRRWHYLWMVTAIVIAFGLGLDLWIVNSK